MNWNKMPTNAFVNYMEIKTWIKITKIHKSQNMNINNHSNFWLIKLLKPELI